MPALIACVRLSGILSGYNDGLPSILTFLFQVVLYYFVGESREFNYCDRWESLLEIGQIAMNMQNAMQQTIDRRTTISGSAMNRDLPHRRCNTGWERCCGSWWP